MKHCLTILLFMIATYQSFAQELFLSDKGQEKLLLIYQKPEADFLSLITEHKNASAEDEYLRLYNLFIAFQSNERMLYAKSFHNGLKQFETTFKSCPKVQLMHTTLLIQQSLLYWNQNKTGDGARSFYKAHRLFKKLYKDQYPDDYIKLQAIFNIFLSQIPEQFQFLASLFGLEGNIDEGFKQLNKHLRNIHQQSGNFCEAMVLQTYCQLKFGKPDKQQVQLLMEQSVHCQSPLLGFIAASLCIKNRMSNEGLTYIRNIDQSSFKSFPLLLYVKGRLMLNQLDLNSNATLQQFTTHYQGRSYRTDALMRQAWYYHLHEEVNMRDSLINQVTAQHHLPTSNDKQAKKEVSSLAQKPVSLLKARLLFDGGNYTDARRLLNHIQPETINAFNLPEYHYRLGRINKELNMLNEAIACFDKTIAISDNDTRYFGPYAAIEAAKIKLIQKDTLSAKSYLDQAYKLNTGEYKQDISRIISKLDNE
ncbi:MAG: hypothetical protein MI866_03975 [Bacteroidales bacterium]|nr:hypothetical protein [Bacteroidales bacterium]